MNLNTLSQSIGRLKEAKNDDERESVIGALAPDDQDALFAFFQWLARRPRRGPKLKLPAGMAVHHLDGDPHNNDPANLRLVDPRENRKAAAPESDAA